MVEETKLIHEKLHWIQEVLLDRRSALIGYLRNPLLWSRTWIKGLSLQPRKHENAQQGAFPCFQRIPISKAT